MFNRAVSKARMKTREVLFPAPTKGWVQSGNIITASPDQAEVLENFFPTAQGARLRGGATEYADIGTAIVRLLTYSASNDEVWAGCADGIYDAERIGAGGSSFADVAGLTSGDWSTTQISTSGGYYLMAANGSDYVQYYDGANWNPIADEALNTLSYDALSSAFSVGETVSGGTSGASAEIMGIEQSSATAGTLKLGAITSGPFQNNEALSSAGGAATADGASASGSAVAITGIATTSINQLWLYKTRVFGIEKNSLSAWYWPVSSLGGALSELDLGPIFRRGGQLMFGATWSIDSGSGIDDVCVFVTTNGEIAVYEGDDPSDTNTWSLAGVYEISRPLNKHAFFKAGGDLAILTEDGIIPISEALRKDKAALQAVAISYPIEDAWKLAVANRTTEYPITPTLWQSQALLMIGVPGGSTAYIANARTGAWAKYVGWDVRCGTVANDRLYFGTNAGKVMRGQNGGSDDGVAYVGKYVPKFSTGGGNGMKVANHAGLTVKAASRPDFRMAAFSDYEIGEYPTSTALTSEGGDVWGTGVWGTFVWGSGGTPEYAFTEWKTVRASGYSIAPVVVVTANQTTVPAFEILATRVRLEDAAAL